MINKKNSTIINKLRPFFEVCLLVWIALWLFLWLAKMATQGLNYFSLDPRWDFLKIAIINLNQWLDQYFWRAF